MPDINEALENVEAAKEQVANGEVVEEVMTEEEYMKQHEALFALKETAMRCINYLDENKMVYNYFCGEEDICITFPWCIILILFNKNIPEDKLALCEPKQDAEGNNRILAHLYEYEEGLEFLKAIWDEGEKEKIRKKILNPDG